MTNTKTWFLVSNTDGKILEPSKNYKIRTLADESIAKVIEAQLRTILKFQCTLSDNCELAA